MFAALLAAAPVLAQPPYPSRPVTIVVPFSDRKSTRLNSSHSQISYAVFCLKKKKNQDVATSPEALHNPNQPQFRDHSAHKDKFVPAEPNPTYQAGFRHDAVQPQRTDNHLSS